MAVPSSSSIFAITGKYDTYKGSTPSTDLNTIGPSHSGKYDTYKGSTPF